METEIIPAYPGLKAVFKSYNSEEDPDLVYDVIAWFSMRDPDAMSTTGPSVQGLIAQPTTNVSPFLTLISNLLIDGYSFAGYSYCPQ